MENQNELGKIWFEAGESMTQICVNTMATFADEGNYAAVSYCAILAEVCNKFVITQREKPATRLVCDRFNDQIGKILKQTVASFEQDDSDIDDKNLETLRASSQKVKENVRLAFEEVQLTRRKGADAPLPAVDLVIEDKQEELIRRLRQVVIATFTV